MKNNNNRPGASHTVMLHIEYSPHSTSPGTHLSPRSQSLQNIRKTKPRHTSPLESAERSQKQKASKEKQSHFSEWTRTIGMSLSKQSLHRSVWAHETMRPKPALRETRQWIQVASSLPLPGALVHGRRSEEFTWWYSSRKDFTVMIWSGAISTTEGGRELRIWLDLSTPDINAYDRTKIKAWKRDMRPSNQGCQDSCDVNLV